MATETKFLYGPEEMTFLGNQSLDIFLSAMVKNGILDEEKATELQQYRVVVSRKGFFGKAVSKILYKDSHVINVVKLMADESEEEKEHEE